MRGDGVMVSNLRFVVKIRFDSISILCLLKLLMCVFVQGLIIVEIIIVMEYVLNI